MYFFLIKFSWIKTYKFAWNATMIEVGLISEFLWNLPKSVGNYFFALKIILNSMTFALIIQKL